MPQLPHLVWLFELEKSKTCVVSETTWILISNENNGQKHSSKMSRSYKQHGFLDLIKSNPQAKIISFYLKCVSKWSQENAYLVLTQLYQYSDNSLENTSFCSCWTFLRMMWQLFFYAVGDATTLGLSLFPLGVRFFATSIW